MGENQSSQALHLEAAFADFESASTKLAAFYQNLEQEVAKLTNELSVARAAELQQLREKDILASRLESLLDALPAGIVVLDGSGQIAEFNPAAADLLGSVSSGQAWVDVVTDAFQPQWDDGHDISLKDGRRVNIETQPLINEPGQILLIKDVTETRRLQELLNHHRRLSAKTELAASLAHQIRTPLASAMLHMSNLNGMACADEPQQRVTSRALVAMRQLERLVEDMLTFARGGKLDADAFDLGHLLERLVASATNNIASGEFELVADSINRDVRLYGNTDALLSMMLNIVNNARAATNGSGRMRIVTRMSSDVVQIRFEDNGPGIPPHELAHIFEPFYTTTSAGTGLGLAVARSIARAHEGDLSVDSDFVYGACFVLSLPIPTPNVALPKVMRVENIDVQKEERVLA